MNAAWLLFPRALLDSPLVAPIAAVGSVAAIAHFPLQRRFAGEAQGHKDPGTVGLISEHSVALAQDLSAPNAPEQITQFGWLTRLGRLKLAVGHLQSVLP